MKHVKTYVAALCSLGLAAVVPVTSHAFTSAQKVSETASATITGGQAAMTVALLNVTGNTAATSIGWGTINAGQGWTEASQYIQIDSTLTLSGSGIQTYTDNTNVTASPRYTGAVSSSTSAGLVNTTTTNQVIPIAWQIVAQGGTPVSTDDPNCTGAVTQPASCVTPFNGFAWFYYTDKAGGLLANAPANFYIQMENAGSPPQIQFAQTSFGNSTSNTNNVYVEGNFANALGGNTYKTSTLTVEMFTP